MPTVFKKGLSRVWILDGGAGPTVEPAFSSWAAGKSADKSYGKITRVEAPSSTERGAYDVVDSFQSGEDNATLGITLRYTLEPSLIKKVADKKCVADIQIHMGKCTDPRDYNHGWATGKIAVFEGGHITSHKTGDLGSLQSGDEGIVDEDVEVSASNYYEIGPMTFAERAKSEVTNEVKAVVVCDSPSCGDCDSPSDGCQKVYYITAPATGSPGLLPEVGISANGLTSIAHESTITTAAVADQITDAACVGDNLVVTDLTTPSLHYADLSDLQDNIATWVAVTTGFVAAKGPNAIDSYSPFDTWLVGNGGYVYFTSDPTAGVSVQDAGVATTQNLNDVDAFSTEIVVAVGASNAVIYTLNGGSTWQSVTGPAVGVALNAVAIRSEKEWWVGSAAGKLYYTKDRGAHWTEKTFPGSGAGNVYSIVWASNSVGFMTHTTAAPLGRILRTISGGNSWYVLPDGSSSLTTNVKLAPLAVCKKDVNTVYAGGSTVANGDGILLKGSTSYV